MKNLILIMCVVLITGAVATKAESIVFTESGQILEGEIWDWVSIYNDDTIVDMEGGLADLISTYDGSTLNMFGGEAEVSIWDYSMANISGGELFAARAHDDGTINIFGDALAERASADDFGIVNITGGSLGAIGGAGSGTINLYSGAISDSINMGGSSIINIFGHDLFMSSSGGAYGDGQVWGFFTDDAPFTIDLYGTQTYSHINLIPEPCTLCLVGLGALLLRKRT